MTLTQGTTNPAHRRIVLLVIAAAALIALFFITSNSTAPMQGRLWNPSPRPNPSGQTTEQRPTPTRPSPTGSSVRR